MSSTLAKPAKKTEVIRMMYMGEGSVNGKPTHMAFMAHTRKGETHVYDQMIFFSNSPELQNYQKNQLLYEHVDFLVTYDKNQLPIEFRFI